MTDRAPTASVSITDQEVCADHLNFCDSAGLFCGSVILKSVICDLTLLMLGQEMQAMQEMSDIGEGKS